MATSSTGILSSLFQEKQDRAAELKKRLADKARNQTSSGLDPEYITLRGELVAFYIEAGTKRSGQMLRDFAGTTGLSLREAQAPGALNQNMHAEEGEGTGSQEPTGTLRTGGGRDNGTGSRGAEHAGDGPEPAEEGARKSDHSRRRQSLYREPQLEGRKSSLVANRV